MHEAIFVVVTVPTNGSIVAFNVVIWVHFCLLKFKVSPVNDLPLPNSFQNRKCIKKVESGFLDTAVDAPGE